MKKKSFILNSLALAILSIPRISCAQSLTETTPINSHISTDTIQAVKISRILQEYSLQSIYKILPMDINIVFSDLKSKNIRIKFSEFPSRVSSESIFDQFRSADFIRSDYDTSVFVDKNTRMAIAKISKSLFLFVRNIGGNFNNDGEKRNSHEFIFIDFDRDRFFAIKNNQSSGDIRFGSEISFDDAGSIERFRIEDYEVDVQSQSLKKILSELYHSPIASRNFPRDSFPDNVLIKGHNEQGIIK